MFLYKNKKENEFKKARMISRREEGVKLLQTIYSFFYYFLVLAFLATTIYVLFFSHFLAIKSVEVNGTDVINKEEIISLTERIMGEEYLSIFPKKNFLLFPSSKLENELKNEFKRIRDVKISKNFPEKILISVEERKLLLLWCDYQRDCFMVDENGVAYGKVDLNSKEATENTLIKVMSGEENRKITEGEKIFDRQRTESFLKINEVFKEFFSSDKSVEINIKSRMAEEISFSSKEGWKIIIGLNFSFQKSLETLKLFLEKQMKDQAERNKLEYIDLRVENRAYYKLKGEEPKDNEYSNQE